MVDISENTQESLNFPPRGGEEDHLPAQAQRQVLELQALRCML